MTLSDFDSWQMIFSLLRSLLPFLLGLVFFLSLPMVALVLKKRDSRRPVQSAEVQIIELYNPVICRHGRPTDRRSAFCAATFETADGQILKFQIPPAQYASLTQDARGTLTYQGKTYLNFRQM